MSIDVEALAKELFLYRTSSNVPLPPDYWERQSSAMREPFLVEARAILARLVPAEERPIDYLAEKDRSAAEYSDTRSTCPRCGEWRDSPTSDCAACGYVPAEDEERLLREALRAVAEKHQSDADRKEWAPFTCKRCGMVWPCDVARLDMRSDTL